MAVNTRLSAPTYKIFEPDALDVMLSQHVLDPLQGGLAGSMLLTHKLESQNNQQQYMESNDKFNSIARGLDAMEIAQKHKEARMKLAPGLLEHGTDAQDILGIEDLLSQSGILGNKTASMFQNKNAAEIAALGAKANADRSGSMDTNKQTWVDPATGVVHEVTNKGRGISTPKPASIDMQSSTPVPTSGNTPVVNQQQTSTRAKAAIGPDAVLVKTEGGIQYWSSPTTKKMGAFDSNGKMIRGN